jgi:8-hydroxy-5-deazaflavin:NADPH oxidoreductase
MNDLTRAKAVRQVIAHLANTTVTTIPDQFGWEPADMGKVEGARAIEPLCILWCIPGFLPNEWTHAFKPLKDS